MSNRRTWRDDERDQTDRSGSHARKHAKGKVQQGPQDHAEGEHGARTRRRIVEQLEAGPREEPVEARLDRARKKAAFEGRRRLVEDRQQSDEAEKNSERGRYYVERERGRTDGPRDNRDHLHGVLAHKGHRSDYKQRGPDGLRPRD